MGRIPPHPGCFRKSGKCRTYEIRNLEECTENGMCECKGLGECQAGEDVERESQEKIACLNQFVKCFAGNGRNWGLNGR
jgi:hypothetical protein